jgi:RimJ/RimL family protein N-acetyltransferase
VTAVIRTERLELIPMTAAFLRASLCGDLVEAERQIGLALPTTWPDIRTVLQLRLDQLESEPDVQPWLLRAIGLPDKREMVGHIGFHGPPGADHLRPWSHRAAEFGFSVFPPHRRRGYAREAASALMQWARDAHGVTTFMLTISPANAASLALAAGLGFTRVGAHVDDIDGPEDIFLLNAVPGG